MKGIVQLAVATALLAGATAADLRPKHQHLHRNVQEKRQQQHAHLHGARHAEQAVEKRGAATVTTWVHPMATAYVYTDGEAVPADEARECIKDGSCIVVGSSKPKFTPPKPSTTAVSSTSSAEPAEFFESKAATTSSTTTSTSSSTTTTSSSSTKAAAPAAAPAAVAAGSGGFTSGVVPCSTFPSAYGAVAVPWVGLGGWASIQSTGSWTPGVSISDIVEPITGPCVPGSFCSYACPPGQTKTQWPVTSQGSTGQSIGGLWCNANGFLELTQPNITSLCTPGLGGLTVKNTLSSVVSVCGTNYPGNEMMNVPTVAQPGASLPLTNLNAATAYQWQGKYTSGQFYVNNAGVTVDQACIWNSPNFPNSAGNWAPVNIGAGTDINGITYLSIFANAPTSTATLNFDIEITGDITAPCYIKGGVYYGGGTGCTTALTSSSGSATFVFKASS